MQQRGAREPQHLSPEHPAVLPGRARARCIWQPGLEFWRKEPFPRFPRFQQDPSLCHLVRAPAQSCYRIPAGLEAEPREGAGDPAALSPRTFCPSSPFPHRICSGRRLLAQKCAGYRDPHPQSTGHRYFGFPRPLRALNSLEKELPRLSSSKQASLGKVQSGNINVFPSAPYFKAVSLPSFFLFF